MSRSLTKRAALATVSLSVASVAIAASPASAAVHQFDPTFTPNAAASTTPDLVGVGSDTSEGALHYLAEGAGSTPGFNAGKADGRLASFAAKDEANPRIVLRSGSADVARPNGSTPGKATLFAPNNNSDVSYARSSSALSTAEVNAGLFAYPFAVDGLKLAVSKTATNAPATITPAQMVAIYQGNITNWSQISGGKDGVIKPFVPQSGSGTRSFFTAQLTSANGGSPVTLGSAVQETQEHSDALIKNDPNAVVPFSTGRAKSADVQLTGGFVAKRALYNVLRQADTSKEQFRAVFGANGFICSSAAAPLIAAAGFEQLAPQGKGGVCGVATQGATSNFLTAEQADASTATSTGLTAQGSPSGKVVLTADITPATAVGNVEFFEGETSKGVVAVEDGEAALVLTGAPAGQHVYTAVFKPTNAEEFLTSTSDPAGATVADSRYEGVLAVTNPATTWGNTKTITVTLKADGNNATKAVKLVYGDAPEQSSTLVNGVASFQLPATLAAGTYWGVVSYVGDDNFAKDFALTKIVVAKATTKTAVKLAATKVKLKKTNVANVAVAVNGTTQKANGTVTLKVGSTTVGTGKVVNGAAKVTLKAWTTTGTKKVVATFTSGSGSYGSSVAPAVAYTVVK